MNIRTCASCELTYVGNKMCPNCSFGHYSAYYVYGSWIRVFYELFTKSRFKKRNNKMVVKNGEHI